MVWQYIGIGSTALAAVLLVLLLWRRRELRRYDAMDLSAEMAAWGMTRLIGPFLRAYVVGNYFGKDSMGRAIRQLITDLRTDGLATLLRECGWKMVEGVFLKNANDRAKLQQLLAATAEKKSE